jgi:hypothetical protein
MSDTQQQKSMSTPASVLAPKQQYVNLMMDAFARFGEICASPSDPATMRAKIAMQTRIMINYIPNPDERKRLKTYREERLREFTKKNNDKTQLSEYTFELDTDIVGELMELMDDILAINERQLIIGTTPVSDLEREYYPNGYTMDQNDDPILDDTATSEEGDE